MTVLDYLRNLPQHKGVKEGCAEGDCGACTVVLGELSGDGLRYRAVDSCLIFLPMLHGKHLITVENLKSPGGDLHPVQQAMIDAYGSQCGFCTPGIVMSLFALYRNSAEPTEPEVRAALAGNLCRCTGYRPIVEAAMRACGSAREKDRPDDGVRTVALLKEIRAGSVVLTTDRQTYYRPAEVPEALEVKRLHPDAIVTNGATDVALRVTKKHELLPMILDLSGMDALRGWSEENGNVRVAAGVSMEDFAEICRERFPAIAGMLGVFGSLQIRNLATIGGNIGTASPVGDLMPVLIAHGATIILQSTRGERHVPASRFVTGYRHTVATGDELITAVVLPPVHPGTILRSYKVSRRRDLDIATVSGGFRLELESGNRIRDVILAYGGMADRVRRAEKAEAFLRGKTWDRPTVEEAMSVIDSDFVPISDVRGSAAMRRIAARNLLLKFWAESSRNGGGPWR
jgi:xanthine dehydrogenase small subunit